MLSLQDSCIQILMTCYTRMLQKKAKEIDMGKIQKVRTLLLNLATLPEVSIARMKQQNELIGLLMVLCAPYLSGEEREKVNAFAQKLDKPV